MNLHYLLQQRAAAGRPVETDAVQARRAMEQRFAPASAIAAQ